MYEKIKCWDSLKHKFENGTPTKKDVRNEYNIMVTVISLN